MLSYVISLLFLLLSGCTAPEPSRRRRAKFGLPRPWRAANRSPSRRRPTVRPRLEALEARCLLSYTINEFPVPTPSSAPAYIHAGPDGNVWFVDYGQNTLGYITPTGQVTELAPFPSLPGIRDFVFAKDGNIWFGTHTDIAEITPQGSLLHDYVIPSALGGPSYGGLLEAIGNDGNIWYTEPYISDILGRLTPNGQITEFHTGFGAADAAEIINGPDGNLWFEATGAYAIGRSTPDGTITLFNLPKYGSGNSVRGLTSGPDGNLWMAADDNQIYRVNTAGQLTGNFAVPTPNSFDYGMTVGSDGALWFSTLTASEVGRITTDGTITEIPIQGIGASREPTSGPDGNIWFTEFSDHSFTPLNQIGEVVLNHPPANVTPSLSATSILAGQSVTLSATFTDPDALDTHTAVITWGDGSPNTTVNLTAGVLSFSGVSHTYGLSGSATTKYTVAVTVTDRAGASARGSTTVTVLPPASLSGTVFADFNDDGQVDFGEKGISGVTVTLTGTDDLGHAVSTPQTTNSDGAYVFLNLRPGSYYLTETQPAGYNQGIDSIGTAGGSLAATDQFFVKLAAGVNGLNYNYGEQPAAGGSAQPGQTATIGFWNNTNGQALINAFNGGPTATQLANWLAATLPHVFGVDAGSNNLTGKSNTAVAALFQQDFLLQGVKVDAQVLATALNVYATNATLDSTGVAAQYGFIVQGDGVGTAGVNVGSNGAAFGVADNTVLTVMDLLKATDAQAVNGVLYNGDATKRTEANTVYSFINQAGNIS